MTATGEIIPNMGERRVRVVTGEGRKCSITFQVAKVDTPVLSTRKLTECGHDVLYQQHGGVIIDNATGQRTKFVQRGGVYYVKLKVLTPTRMSNLRILRGMLPEFAFGW